MGLVVRGDIHSAWSEILSPRANDTLITIIIGLVIEAVILWYLFKPHVKEFFGVQVSFST